MSTATRTLPWLATFPGRCPRCLLDTEHQGHRAEIDGVETGCTPSGPLGLLLAREARDAGMARTVAAHPDDAARVDAVLARFIATGRPFSANDTRPYLAGVKGSVVGSCWRAASQARRIVRTGRRFPSTDPGTHAHHIDEWVAA